jgi:hypothetical protein
LTADAVPFTTDDDILFFQGVDFINESVLSSHPPQYLAEELARVVRVTAPRARSHAGVDIHIPKDVRLELMAKFPWLTEKDFGIHGFSLNRRRVDKLGERVDDDLDEDSGGSHHSDEEHVADEGVLTRILMWPFVSTGTLSLIQMMTTVSSIAVHLRAVGRLLIMASFRTEFSAILEAMSFGIGVDMIVFL